MNIYSLFPYVPVTASILLIIVGIAILGEIYTMFIAKLPKKQKVYDTSHDPDHMKPLKFPKVSTVKAYKKNVSTGIHFTFKLILMIILIIVAGLNVGLGIFYIRKHNISYNFFNKKDYSSSITPSITQTQNQPAHNIPLTPLQKKQYDAQIVLYQETKENIWKPLREEELSTLNAGDVIRIAVKTKQIPNRIEITVNNIPIPLSSGYTPNNEPFARYVIPRGQSEYKVAVKVY